MKKIKNMKGIIIPVVLIIFLGTYLLLRKENSVNYDIPVLPDVQGSDIDKIVVSGPAGEVVIQSAVGSWTIMPQGWPADEGGMKNILDNIVPAQPVDLISDKDTGRMYDLDSETAIIVRLEIKGSVVKEISIGKKFPAANYSYIQIPDDKNIYSARGDLRRYVGKSADELRSKIVLKYNAADIKVINYLENEVIREDWFKKAEDGLWYMTDGDSVDPDKVKNLNNRLASLSCRSYTELPPDAVYKGKIILQGNESYWLEIYNETEEGYIAKSSMSQDAFILSAYQAESFLDTFKTED